MELTVGVGATTITCNNPVLHSITLLFYFPSTVYDTTSVLKGQANQCDSQIFFIT